MSDRCVDDRSVSATLLSVTSVDEPDCPLFRSRCDDTSDASFASRSQSSGRSIRDAFDEHAFGSANGCEIVVRSYTFEDWARGAAASVIDSMVEGTPMGAP